MIILVIIAGIVWLLGFVVMATILDDGNGQDLTDYFLSFVWPITVMVIFGTYLGARVKEYFKL